jgi:transcriptional regulator with PAS, ATPase and Fis domain
MRVAQYLGVSRAAVYRRIEVSPAYRLASDIAADELQRLLREHAGDSAAVARHLRVSLAGLRSQLRKFSLDWH